MRAGHQLMMECGGILHRDVSSANTLIVEESQEHPSSMGILHDYDCSSTTLSQGTYYFKALALVNPLATVAAHDSHHDLESFFWVLLWIILRHTKHEHKSGERACQFTFHYGEDELATMGKKAWLDRIDDHDVVLVITSNPPLTALLSDFHSLVWKANKGIRTDRVPLSYKTVLDVFDAAIEREDWPVDDAAIPYALTSTPWDSLIPTRPQESQDRVGDKRPRTLDDDGVQSDSDDQVKSMMSLHSSASAMAAKRPKISDSCQARQ